jgi:zona occludens toxin
MSISAYVGLPGSGKSHGVVEHVIIPALKSGRVVFTNIPMNQDLLIQDFGAGVIHFDVDDIKKDDDWFTEVFEPGAIWVCDELWRLWPAGLRANQIPEEQKAFLAEHRHMVGDNGLSTEIILVTQDLQQVSAFARNLVEHTYRTEKLTKIGSSKRYRLDIYFGPVTGPNPPKAKRDREIFSTYKKDVFQYYQSHTKSATGQAGDETRTDNRFNGLKGFKAKAILAGVFGFPILALYLGFVFWGHWSDATESHEVDSQPVAPPVDSPPPVQPVREKRINPITRAYASLLDKVDYLEIVWNNWRPGAVTPDYKFRVSLKDGFYRVFSIKELQLASFQVTGLGECMALVKGPTRDYMALCQSEVSDEPLVDMGGFIGSKSDGY